MAKEEKIVSALCAAPIVLDEAGLLESKNFTCYPGFEGNIKTGNHKTDITVKDGKVITGRGPAAAIPFAFEILKQIAPEKVEEIKKAMLFN